MACFCVEICINFGQCTGGKTLTLNHVPSRTFAATELVSIACMHSISIHTHFQMFVFGVYYCQRYKINWVGKIFKVHALACPNQGCLPYLAFSISCCGFSQNDSGQPMFT